MSAEYDDEAREWFVGTGNPVEVRLLGETALRGIITSWNEIGLMLSADELMFVPWLRVVRISIPDPQQELDRVEGNKEARDLKRRSAGHA